MILVIDLHSRSVAASSQAFHFGERKESIWSCFALLEAQLVGDVLENSIGTEEQTRNVGTNLNMILSYRLRTEHTVERNDFVHLNLRDLQVLRNDSN
jgi:hypothetical protein